MDFPGLNRAQEEERAAVLIAEDDENDIILIKRAFHQAGFENPLQVVRDGGEAVAYLQGNGRYIDRTAFPWPALVLLDIRMPRKNGFEVLKWIREQSELDPLPVVMLTSSQESCDINQAYALGANSYLVKPASFAALVEMLNRLKQFSYFTQQNMSMHWAL